MVAYSFQQRFVPAIESGAKPHTIRGPRRRHARPGDELQLYAGMRTRSCRLIRRARCRSVLAIALRFGARPLVSLFPLMEKEPGHLARVGERIEVVDLDRFAVSDGFADFDDMARFWRDSHGASRFDGFIIIWGQSPRRVYRTPLP